MRRPTLYGPLTFSLFLHVSIFVIASIIISQSNIPRLTTPYIVSLVADQTASAPSVASEKAEVTPRRIEKAVAPPTNSRQRDQQRTRIEDERLLQERLAALQAKKKIERIAELRRVVDVGSSRGGSKVPSSGPAPSRAGPRNAQTGADYDSVVVSRIRQQWIFPETIDKAFEAVISIRIARDGKVSIERIEKSSGNPLFDRSVLRAITLASPLPPPPQEMEMGVRFHP